MTHRKPKTAPALQAVPVNPYEAFRLVVYSHGVKELAERMGMSPGVLYNKADASVESQAQPTLRDVVAVTRETGDMRILESLNRLFGRGSVELKQVPASDAALLELLAHVGSEHGAMCAALTAGLAEAGFTPGEFETVRGEAFDLINAVLQFVQRLEGLVDAP
jgi:hypothetical protein